MTIRVRDIMETELHTVSSKMTGIHAGRLSSGLPEMMKS